jgi:predicted GNAT family acetyltransferase
MKPDSPARPEWIVRDNPERHRFEIDLGDATAIAQYALGQGIITFTHTVVPPEFGGQGIGTALIRAGLQAARERGLKVVPLCPFFAAYLQRHGEEQDLLEPAWRERLKAEGQVAKPGSRR